MSAHMCLTLKPPGECYRCDLNRDELVLPGQCGAALKPGQGGTHCILPKGHDQAIADGSVFSQGGLPPGTSADLGADVYVCDAHDRRVVIKEGGRLFHFADDPGPCE